MTSTLMTETLGGVDDRSADRPEALSVPRTMHQSQSLLATGVGHNRSVAAPFIAMLPFDIDVDPSILGPEQRLWASKPVLGVPHRPPSIDVGGMLCDCVRVQATDLRDARRQAQQARENRRDGDGDTVAVVVDIEVLIGQTSADARASLAQRGSRGVTDDRRPPPMRYVGTASGLRSLIDDIHTLRIADGVMLLPLGGASMIYDLIGDVLCTLNMAPVD
ncbi:hypothetical protein CIW52_06905 [Mycolicibacterium sp. P9-64]|nr:hypothetical protein CIW52_06905 [Mycolicibacterium sp. P9-64]